MGEGPATQVTHHLPLGTGGLGVSVGAVALQCPHSGQHLWAARAPLFGLLVQGAALGVGRQTTLVGEGLGAPAAGVGLGGGGFRFGLGFPHTVIVVIRRFPVVSLLNTVFCFVLLAFLFLVGAVVCKAEATEQWTPTCPFLTSALRTTI